MQSDEKPRSTDAKVASNVSQPGDAQENLLETHIIPMEIMRKQNQLLYFEQKLFKDLKHKGLLSDEDQELGPYRTRRGIGFILEQIQSIS